MPPTTSTPPLPRFRCRSAAVTGLLMLSPISAEYLTGHGESTGRPLELLAGPLIREITRRTGRGWPTVLLLSAAFGVIQAGLDGTVKYAVNATMLGGVLALLLTAAHRLLRQEPSAC